MWRCEDGLLQVVSGVTSPLLAIDGPTGRYYPRWGRRLPSATTLIGQLAKPGLLDWIKRKVAEAALSGCSLQDAMSAPDDHRDKAGRLGDAVHGHAENMMRAVMDYATDDELREYVKAIPEAKVRSRTGSWLQWFFDYRPIPLYVEATLFNEDKGYAGSCDLIAVIPGFNDDGAIATDYKTSKGVYGTVALQLGMYTDAETLVDDDGVEYENPARGSSVAAVLHIKPHSYEFRAVDLTGVERAISALCAIKYWLDNYEATAIGLPIEIGVSE